MLRSGKELPSPTTPSDNPSLPGKSNEEAENNEGKYEAQPSTLKVSTRSSPFIEPYIPKALFPSRLVRPKQEHRDEELIEMYKKVQINIRLLNAIQKIPRNRVIIHAMLDLGASINAMPYHVYEDLKLNDLQETVVCIQLADRSYMHPLGIVEDVLLQVKDLIFPVDFDILKMDEISSPSSSTVMLGRSFMKTAKTKIDVNKGCLSIEFDGEVVSFNMYDSMKFPEEYMSLCLIEAHDFIDDIALRVKEFLNKRHKTSRQQPQQDDGDNNSDMLIAPSIDLDFHDLSLSFVHVSNLEKPSSNFDILDLQVQRTELKALPSHLKYVYLGEGNTLPIIISRELTSAQEESLIEILKTYKEANGWTLDDLK
ncbi:uncharacterized protein LOC120075497 [Benincasa hispida]|uniref:uncharacterized protein LOC120075497 n=1 Tax=Benincasa hispida TaxID=102211 RepID=UPI0018FF14B0|nr:uncharacterized protein LOC120075497 [Benincasa hispida]